MKTKLVYILTCAPKDHYIEQALMSIYSARYRNPDAQIILITDDETNQLFEGKRGEINKYISKIIIIPFIDKTISPQYKSRWLKTNVRQLIDGDYLFIDCDTIINNSLGEIDGINCTIGAVLDEHCPIRDYPIELRNELLSKCNDIGFDISVEEYYYNSGVMLVKDKAETRRFYDLWHREYINGYQHGIKADQPSMAKVNTLLDHIISPLSDKWNSIVYMRPRWIYDANIIHFWNFRNVSFLYSTDFLIYVKENGITEFIKYFILHPVDSLPPIKTILSRYKIADWFKCQRRVSHCMALLSNNVPKLLPSLPWPISPFERKLLQHRLTSIFSIVFCSRLFITVKKKPIYDNVCWGE